jgi:hypothetical protein
MNAPTKPFTWSYSRLKNFEVCPKRHWHIDIQKDVKEEESEQLAWGNALHAAAAKHLKTGVALPPQFDILKGWCSRLVTSPGNLLVEQKLAITKDFNPCGYFDKGVWFRGVIDVLKINGPVALAIDWKTGKILEDPVQLALFAQCVFSHHPGVQKIRTIYAWLKEGPDIESSEDFTRSQMVYVWKNLLPRVEQLEHAWNTTSYPATPNRLCRKWCPVTKCPHHGE